MILNDRITDIYQNYSICENNCKYDSVNLTDYTVKCSCSVKSKVDNIEEPPNLKTIIKDSFKDSNLAVILCYKLVFSFKNKLKNIGFIIFSLIIISHIPTLLYYFITNIKYINQFILNQMRKNNYFSDKNNNNNPPKKSESKRKRKRKKSTKNKEIIHKINKKINKINNIKVHKSKIKNNFENCIESQRDFINNKNIDDIKEIKKNTLKNINKPSIIQINYNVINKNIINTSSDIKKPKNKKKKNNEKKETNKNDLNSYILIHIDANNSFNNEQLSSNIILDNYEYETAIIYDKRTFWRILYICIIAKENILNMILFKTPLDIFSLRLILFIFNYSSDLAFNTIFYSNESISDKYHYKGKSILLFSIINNFIQINFYYC